MSQALNVLSNHPHLTLSVISTWLLYPLNVSSIRPLLPLTVLKLPPPSVCSLIFPIVHLTIRSKPSLLALTVFSNPVLLSH